MPDFDNLVWEGSPILDIIRLLFYPETYIMIYTYTYEVCMYPEGADIKKLQFMTSK